MPRATRTVRQHPIVRGAVAPHRPSATRGAPQVQGAVPMRAYHGGSETDRSTPVLSTPGRLTRGLLPVAAAALLLAGCSGEGEPTASGSGSAVPSVSTSGPTTSTSSASSSPSTPSTSSAGPSTSTTATTPSPAPASPAPSVAEVFRAARTSSLSAQSGHVTGTVTHDGTRLRIDLEGQANGLNQTVFITTPKGGTAEVLTVGDGYWVGGDEAHWTEITGDPKAAAALVGKYAPVTESDATELGSFTLRSLLTDAFGQPDLAVLESDTGAAAEAEVDGRAAYLLGRKDGARLWVAADGSGTLLRVVGPRSEPSDLSFSGWGRARTFTEPPPDRIIEN